MVASDVETSALLKALSEAKLFLKQGCHWKRDQLPEVLIAYWISQLCNAIYFLHSQGIIIRFGHSFCIKFWFLQLVLILYLRFYQA